MDVFIHGLHLLRTQKTFPQWERQEIFEVELGKPISHGSLPAVEKPSTAVKRHLNK
jgi:hypothetical protein